jgi:hypothetical protein
MAIRFAWIAITLHAVRYSPLTRATIYSLTGYTTECAFSALHDLFRHKPVAPRTSPWMLPIYALIQPLFERAHDRLRDRPPLVRAATYGVGFLAVEYGAGTLLRRLRGRAPWDYTYARRHVNGLIRPDYFVVWAVAGLALEPLHDRLVE